MNPWPAWCLGVACLVVVGCSGGDLSGDHASVNHPHAISDHAIGNSVLLLEDAGQWTSTDDIVTHLELIRRGSPLSPAELRRMLSLAREDAAIYANRDKSEAARLYPYTLLIIAEAGSPEAVMTRATDMIAHGHSDYEVAVAARILSMCGARAQSSQRYLADAVLRGRHDEPLSLERFDLNFPEAESTTARIELVRAIAAIHPDPKIANAALGEMLRQHRAAMGPTSNRTRLQNEIAKALRHIQPRGQSNAAEN